MSGCASGARKKYGTGIPGSGDIKIHQTLPG